NVLIIASYPILTVTVALLTLDRYLGTHFFTNDMGGNMMMYINKRRVFVFSFNAAPGIHPFLTIHSIGGKNAKRFTTGTNDNLP
ncbi:hypothetical protein MJM04_34305, partial [Salmonella enterica subsp. enterica serovar Cerro]|nr:hypothetical protein [Salmonella enterica subsp. enterica serovar Cerro]